VAAPEAANNAAAQTAFIPTLTLGIPGSAVMALMVGAMTMQASRRAAGDRPRSRSCSGASSPACGSAT
jgi:hypothetical protein